MILCFSGTGNSRFVADRLAERLGDHVMTLDPDVRHAMPDGDRRVIWVFPVHAWSVPPVVAAYMANCPRDAFSSEVRHYMVATCGDDIGRTDLVWRALVRSCGWHDAGAYSVRMPNTYVLLPGFDVDSRVVEQAKLRDAEIRILQIADGISRGWNGADVVPGVLPDIKTKVLGPLFRRFLMSPRPFRVNRGKCSGCGSCARNCPLHNVTMEAGYPEWGMRCSMCLACYHGCRCNAVEYGRVTRTKGRYRGPVLKD